MLSFKQFLYESDAALATPAPAAPSLATAQAPAQAPLKSNIPLQFAQQPSPNQIKPKPTKPVGKENTKKPINKRSDDDNGDDQDFDGWLANHPMPDPSDPRYDSNGDGMVDEDKRDAYNQAWQTWRDNLLDWMLQNVENREPRVPGEDEPYYPGESDGQWRQWLRDRERTSDERYNIPADHPLNLPPDMSKEDYEFWKELLRIKGPEARDLFDWIWRFYRAGQPDFPGVHGPIDSDGYVDPLFPNSPSRIPRRPGEYNA